MLTDTTMTIEDVRKAADEMVAAQTKVATGIRAANTYYKDVKAKADVLAERITQAIGDGITTQELADTLTAAKVDGKSWQKSEMAFWDIAHQISQKPDLPSNTQVARIPDQWIAKGERGWVGNIPLYDSDGNIVIDAEGKEQSARARSLVTLVRSACDKQGVTDVKSTVKSTKTGKAIIETLEGMATTTKAPKAPTRDQLLRRAAKTINMAAATGVPAGDDAKSKVALASIDVDLPTIKKALGIK